MTKAEIADLECSWIFGTHKEDNFTEYIYNCGAANSLSKLYDYLYCKIYEDNLADDQIMYEIDKYIRALEE